MRAREWNAAARVFANALALDRRRPERAQRRGVARDPLRRLQHLDLGDAGGALAAKPTEEIAAAACAIAASHATLTFYERFALRPIGARHVPYRSVALVASPSYSIGHDVGGTVLTGGAVPYRGYSAFELYVTHCQALAPDRAHVLAR